MSDKQKISLFVRMLTLAAAEVAFVGLAAIFVYETWAASGGESPDLSAVQGSALAGLAVLLGGGFGVVLGAQGQGGAKAMAPDESVTVAQAVKKAVGERTLLFAGVIIYMLAGFVICATYALNEAETPSILKTIAVAFAGYVVAFVSTAYQQLSEDAPAPE
jgi:hypothetical protein